MKLNGLKQCVDFLKAENELIVIDTPVDPDLEMAHITRRVFKNQGPALLFTRIKGSRFPALSNLMGTWERTVKLFEPQLAQVKALIDLRCDPGKSMRSFRTLKNSLPALMHSLPVRQRSKPPVMYGQCQISDLPMIRCWPKDGGAFILLPQVFSMDPEKPSIFASNLGMYRIQMSGNQYIPDKEIGLHYQIHRGIGNHHQKALALEKPLAVSIFIGGPPAHTLAAVMPLPEGMPEIAFAGALAGRNFKFFRQGAHLLSAEADFCITGIVMPGKTKMEGPFGDHMGYYSLAHEYPYLNVTGVYHKKDAIFPFTVVGRPPQEDSNFGRLIHEIAGSAVKSDIPGVTAVNAVDEAGVHPLLLVKARERYVPFQDRKPRELLTHACRILGTGQLSLAKYVMICAQEDEPQPDIHDPKAFFIHMLARINFKEDLHFITKTTIDTLDYSSKELNQGSKLIMAAAGQKKRTLATRIPVDFSLPDGFYSAKMAAPGILVVKGPAFIDYSNAKKQMARLVEHLADGPDLKELPMMVIADDSEFAADCFSNFLWITFLKSNPSHDIYGMNETIAFKHWQCEPPMIIDARSKPFHADILEPDRRVAERIEKMGQKGGVLYKII